ncbi:dihydroorotate dehydrogenase [Robertmurraya massiliosenegalensis]|uniref:dihydroorotate dehydrogenase n=1 Tax=Robertmurraya TaxID=2837507 RepID=UPI0039A78032
MPDWSYHPLFKPWLFRLPGEKGREFIHRGMSFISSLPGGVGFIEFLGHMAPSPQLKKDFCDLSIASPIGLSGKVDPLLTGTKAFSHLGFGFIEIGPISASPHREKTRLSDNKQQIHYSLPFESPGMENAITKLENLKSVDIPFFIRIGKTNDFQQLLFMIDSLLSFADAFILEDILKEHELTEIKRHCWDKNLILSLPHLQLEEWRDEISQLHRKKLIDGLVIEESFVKEGTYQYAPLVQNQQLALAVKQIKEGSVDLPIIISGGIQEPNDALLLLEAGADLVLLSTGYVLSGPGLPKRINEALLDRDEPKQIFKGWGWYWLFGLCIFLGGLLALMFSMTSVILPYDEVFLQMTREQLIALNPRLINFMAHDRMTLAGTMISGGIVYMCLARFGVRYGIHWARRAINLAGGIGFLGIFLFIGYGYFDWLHGLFWAILSPIFYLGWKTTKGIREVSRSRNRTNHSSWKKGIRGQLAFTILGFSFVLGGLVISTIGITNVFVPTDILYICMTPEQLHDITSKLIPVIAHDRAGFGGALISVGLLVFTLSLWGFHQGEKWVWYTFLFGGIPAFAAGIATHFVIGYTTFIHLLPAYFALFLFIVGLFLSREFLFEKERK